MGSQTLEILRQGVWASLTGGWFYDPHQDNFCNTFHLYVWLLLLCLPFTIYLYLPPTVYVWATYCGCVGLLFTVLKVASYGLHHMFDTSECVQEYTEESRTELERRRLHGAPPDHREPREEEGIELQVLPRRSETPPVATSSRNSYTAPSPPSQVATDADSIDSVVALASDGKPGGSTIDLKVDVHRKNSSESSEEVALRPVVQKVSVLRAEQCTQPEGEAIRVKIQENLCKRLRNRDAYVAIAIVEEGRPVRKPSIRKQAAPPFLDEDEVSQQGEPPQEEKVEDSSRRYSNVSNVTYNLLNLASTSTASMPVPMKTAGSLELPDGGESRLPPDKGLIYWKQQNTRHSSLDPPSPTSTMDSRTDPLEGSSRPSESARGLEQNNNQAPSTSSLRVRSAHTLPELGSETDPRDTGSCSLLLFRLSLGALDKPTQPRKSLPEHFAMLREEHKPSRDSLQEDIRESKSRHKHRRRSSSPTSETSEGEVSSSPSLASDEEANHQPPTSIQQQSFPDCVVEEVEELPKVVTEQINATSEPPPEERPSPQSVLCLDWLFEDTNCEETRGVSKESSDSGSSSTTTLSVSQQEAARLLPKPFPSPPPPPILYRSQGAIPKRRTSHHHHHHHHHHPRNNVQPGTSTSGSGKINEEPQCEVPHMSPQLMRRLRHPILGEMEHRRRSSNELTAPSSRSRQCCGSGEEMLRPVQPQDATTEGLELLNPPSLAQRGFIVGSHTRKRHPAGRSSGPFGPAAHELAVGSLLVNPSFTPFVDLSPDELPMARDPPRSRQRHRRLKRSSRTHRGSSGLPSSTPLSALHHHHHRHNLHSLRQGDQAGSTSAALGTTLNTPLAPFSALPLTVFSPPGTHIASSHDDTSEGAVHCFQDEFGHWLTYTFDEKGTGTATSKLVRTLFKAPSERNGCEASMANAPGFSKSLGGGNNTISPPSNIYIVEGMRPSGRSPMHPMHSMHGSLQERSQQATSLSSSNNLAMAGGPASSQGETDTDYILVRPRLRPDEPPKPKQYYKFKLTPWNKVRINFDRLELLALLDRNLTIWESILSILLAILVGIFGALMLNQEFFDDAKVFLFCFVVASCQYSLLKSVQPDAASPTHGYNRVVAFSRPVYFCICCALILILDSTIHSDAQLSSLRLYGVNFSSELICTHLRDGLLWFILCFPITFSLGLLPQVNTFAMYLLEQVDMHMFGGNATSSLIAALYCVLRSVFAVGMLYGFAYGGLNEQKSSQHFLFSIFCGLLVSCSYHLSRSASDPSFVWQLVKKHMWPEEECAKPKTNNNDLEPEEPIDPLPAKLQKTVNARLRSDLIVCPLTTVFVFGIHCSTVFTALKPELSRVMWALVCVLGFLLHYIMPQLRKQLPWLCFSTPIFKTHEYNQFEVREAARVMWFEKIYIVLCFLEKNILYPVLFIGALTESSPLLVEKFGSLAGPLIVTICGIKCVRSSFSNTPQQYLVLVFTILFFEVDYHKNSETFLVNYCVMSVIFSKMYEFLLKVQFVVTYIAPWQITWGSPFHAFAQPFSVPHSAMLFLQAFASAILSAPLNPFLGSAIFLASYVRPVKFWERDYNTRRVDHSNTRLSSHLERNLGADDNNLNSIFYEHLTRSLQHSLCGDLILGRWGPVSQGDCFVLASDYLNCLVHVVELGNGLVTFQMRGLEFRGTYCQQREVEAISEGVEEDDGCCCCEPGHIPHMLSVNAAFSQRWLAWEVTATKYVLEGYSITDNSAISMLQVFDFRKVLITYYVKSIIYYAVRSSRLEEWLSSMAIGEAMRNMSERGFVDLDPVFNMNIDEDYDFRASGITRNSFCNVYLEWIQYCASRREKAIDSSRDSPLVTLCFALSLLGRRTLGSASHNTVSSVEFFLYGLHALFKGDFRITSLRDEWIFSDMDLLRKVVAPGVRMSLKLHQDHFMSPDEYELHSALYNAIMNHEEKLVISHEGDPIWRNAVLSGTPSLLALRHVLDDGSDEYKVIMLNKRYLSFRVIKVNRECVRGLWAGQQQELVYLRNRNPERGSIQNAKQVLRNIINSSCDQPIGYPIYVSPLTTSYAETNEQLTSIVGGPISLGAIKQAVIRAWKRLRTRCGEGCSSGGLGPQDEGGFGHEGVYAMTTCNIHTGYGHMGSGPQLQQQQPIMETTQFMGPAVAAVSGGRGSLGRGSLGRTSLGANRSSLGSTMSSSAGKPSSATLASLAGLLSDSGSMREKERERESETSMLAASASPASAASTTTADKEPVLQRVRIRDPNLVYDAINLGRRIDVVWPDERMRARGGRSHWKDWLPEKGMEGQVVHRWVPCHRDPNQRSHVDRTIVLVQIDDKFVPIAEAGVQDLGAEV